MRVKRYVVNSMPDALEKIRMELGKDAVILNTKPIRTGGLFGLFSKQQIEVIAAVDAKAPEPAAVPAGAAPVHPAGAAQAYQRTVRPEPTRQPDPLPTASRAESVPAGRFASPRTAPSPQEVPGAPAVRRIGTDAAQRPVHPDEADIAREIRDMREMFQKLLLKGDGEEHLPQPFAAVRSRLLEQEVEEELVADILARVLKSFPDPAQAGPPEVRRAVAAEIARVLSERSTVPPGIPRTVRYACFFGPTGVGKTTTIAKLAAECVLREKRKVGFITSDTYRIAAVEQLRTYANILNVPLEVVFSPREVEQAMERLAGMDLVLIDTAGRNYRNDEFVKGVKEYLRFGDSFENYLVLSLTSRYSDIKPVVENFSDVPIAKVIFTKSDETGAYGSILNVIHRFGLSLSYITTGQNVPDDVVVATPELVADWILGDGVHA